MYKVDKLKSREWKKYAKANLPTKYIDHDIKDFRILGDGKTKKQNEEAFAEFMDYYNNAEDYLAKGQGLYLCGPVGVAKTWLMTHLAKKVIEVFDNENGAIIEENLDRSRLNRFHYIQGTTISRYIFPTGLNEIELMERRAIKTIAGLWIDDISKMGETKGGHEVAFLDDILRWRDLNCLTTFYTSQIPFDSAAGKPGMDTYFSKPIHDMIRGNCKVITFRGESQR